MHLLYMLCFASILYICMVRGKERRGTYDYEVYLQQEDDDESAILSHACLWGNLSSHVVIFVLQNVLFV